MRCRRWKKLVWLFVNKTYLLNMLESLLKQIELLAVYMPSGQAKLFSWGNLTFAEDVIHLTDEDLFSFHIEIDMYLIFFMSTRHFMTIQAGCWSNRKYVIFWFSNKQAIQRIAGAAWFPPTHARGFLLHTPASCSSYDQAVAAWLGGSSFFFCV